MSARLSRLIVFFFMLFSSSIASAEDYDNPYNFSVEVGGGILFAPRMKADNGTKDVWTNHNFSGYVKGMSFKLRGEYYIPSTNFSIKGGIENESFQIQDSYVSEPLKQIMLGGRYYPIGMLKVFRPYVGFDTYYNIGRKRTEDFVSQSEGISSFQRLTRIGNRHRNDKKYLGRFGIWLSIRLEFKSANQRSSKEDSTPYGLQCTFASTLYCRNIKSFIPIHFRRCRLIYIVWTI